MITKALRDLGPNLFQQTVIWLLRMAGSGRQLDCDCRLCTIRGSKWQWYGEMLNLLPFFPLCCISCRCKKKVGTHCSGDHDRYQWYLLPTAIICHQPIMHWIHEPAIVARSTECVCLLPFSCGCCPSSTLCMSSSLFGILQQEALLNGHFAVSYCVQLVIKGQVGSKRENFPTFDSSTFSNCLTILDFSIWANAKLCHI